MIYGIRRPNGDFLNWQEDTETGEWTWSWGDVPTLTGQEYEAMRALRMHGDDGVIVRVVLYWRSLNNAQDARVTRRVGHTRQQQHPAGEV